MLQVKEIITNQKSIEKGFIWQAQKKRELSEHFSITAKLAKTLLKKVNSFEDIYNNNIIFDFIIGTLMLSKKSIINLDKKVVKGIIEEQINFKKLSNQNYVNQLGDNYLISSGESVGGANRNIIGKKREAIFIENLERILIENSITYKKEITKTGNTSSITYSDRRLIFNKKPYYINKSVDFIVIKKINNKFDMENPNSYCCAGELKSGIDPAGADEHWKTARTALKRINTVFLQDNKTPPPLYFVGGAISNHMACEIIEMLERNRLKYAANLNNKSQLKKICQKILLD